MAPAPGGDRPDRRHRCRVPAGRIIGALVIIGLWVVGAGAGPAAEGAGAPKATHRAASSGPALTLLATPGIAGPGTPFSVRLGLSGDVPRSDLSLSVTVYRHVVDPTQFDETLSGSPVGSVVASSGAIPVASLPADSGGGAGGVDLSVPVTAGGRAGTGTGPFTADLDCAVGSCGGVYPLRLELTDTTSGRQTRLMTYLVYTDATADVEPLRLALVVPLLLRSSVSAGGEPAVTAPALGSLNGTLDALSGSDAGVPLTIAPGPATVAALEADRGARAREALGSLVALTAQADRQTLCGPFVPVDASALVTPSSAGAGELAQQIHRGVEVLESVPGLHTGGCAAGDAWVADGTLDTSALDALDTLGYHDVVVPPDAVSGPNPSTTPTRVFTWDGGPAAGRAILSDPDLSSRLQSASPDPALAADQILAELELDYYEAPNTTEARGVVVPASASQGIDPAVLADVLDGLAGNPMVQAVTLSELFSQVPVGGTVLGQAQPSPRRPAPAPSSGLPVRSILTARGRFEGFSAAVAGSAAGRAVATGLDDLLLAAESQRLTPAQQRAAVGRFDEALNQQAAVLSITSRQVRLTARTGSVPITVIKTASYPVAAVLTLTSDKIAFSSGSAQVPNTECATPVVTDVAGRSSVSTRCTFIHGTNAVYIEMRSRVSGDFRMSATLTSPEGGLELASGQVTVRSMSTSAVAIALSAAAGAVLLGWWGRTVWRSRRTRRGAHRRGAVT